MYTQRTRTNLQERKKNSFQIKYSERKKRRVMVKSDVLRSITQSSQMNATWYLKRLKTYPDNRTNSSNNYLHEHNINCQRKLAKVRQGSTSTTQGQQISTTVVRSTIKQNQRETNEKKCSVNHRSNSISINSSKSFKSKSSTNKISSPLSEFNSNSYQSLTRIDKDTLSQRRTSSTTLSSLKSNLSNSLNHQRCQRISSSTRTTIDKETCQLLGPQLCSDCIQIQTRLNLSPQPLTKHFINQHLTVLALRKFLKNQNQLTDEDLIEMIENKQIELINQRSDYVNSSILTDEQYFDRISRSLNQYAGESSPYYFTNLKDFAQKYQSNKYQRLLLCETPVPTSSNPLFNRKSVEKFDISSKYSHMKRASTIQTNFKCQPSTFVSPNQIDPFHLKHRSLNNYSPNFISQNIPNKSNSQKRTLIGSNYSFESLSLSNK